MLADPVVSIRARSRASDRRTSAVPLFALCFNPRFCPRASDLLLERSFYWEAVSIRARSRASDASVPALQSR